MRDRIESIVYSLILLALLGVAGCSDENPISSVYNDTPPDVATSHVSLVKKASYLDIVIDYTGGAEPEAVGEELMYRIKHAVPNVEELLDAYLSNLVGEYYPLLMPRLNNIKPQIPSPYLRELEGMARQCSGGTVNEGGDNRLSMDELIVLNLTIDILRLSSCSAVGVFGDRSGAQGPVAARNLDWYDDGTIAALHSVTTIKNGDKSLCMIGCAGLLSVLTAFNDDGVFAGILDAPSGETYSSAQKRSYGMDLRHALETYTTLEDVGAYMTDPSRNYSYNHLIFLADKNSCQVVENNFSGTGSSMTRALRTSSSPLREGITWSISDAIGVVNCFMLPGNHDNYSGEQGNTARWASLVTELTSKGATVSVDELKEVIGYDGGDGPGMQSEGDLYCNSQIHTVLFQPRTMTCEVAFKPADGNYPDDPQFETIEVSFDK